MGTFAVYCDAQDWLLNSTANIETASLVGGNTTTSGAVSAGATSVPLASASGFPASGTFLAWILDGLSSEKVAGTISGSNLSVPGGVQAGHGAGVNVLSAGVAGNLGDVIARASRAIDNYCRQGPDGAAERTLYALSRTERASGPSMRCSFDPGYTFVIHPWHWPIQSVSNVSVQYSVDPAISLAIGNVAITNDGKRIEVPYATLNPSNVLNNVVGYRGQGMTANWTYVAGPCGPGALSGVPDDIRAAMHLFIADILTQRQNPYGLSDVQQGKVHRTFRNRGDDWTSMFRERIYELLEQYAQQGWVFNN